MILSKINDHIPVSTFVGQRKWSPTGLVRCTYIGVLSDAENYYDKLHTSRITMVLVHKVFNCVQVAISTGKREWGVTSLIDWL